ncbi:hypothetical protein C4559_04395 [Candidatus Microgenomates bacterium]|nr:MAG: hypothetical protein C4559_04395 [Candidatus Microgenomates bacterium]
MDVDRKKSLLIYSSPTAHGAILEGQEGGEKNMAKDTSVNIIGTFEQFFVKAPALPANAKEIIVKITPILSLVFGVLGILASLGGLGLLTAFSPVAAVGGVPSYGLGFVSAILWLLGAVLLLLAFTGTKARKISGWNFLFWSELVNVAGSFISMSFISGIIGGLITFYILFQIKSYYK